ncbi:hypothetical protein GCU60_18405 [Blastococcus saxobsidens]|uniref:Uncharacterized protein n=1 Tax=Blastococcus saxobsidens TaxID=138336 RepID=A0A6L9W887_9ACTN|nr:hypothetical protein [Blastococcus saxobsidens]
MKNPNDATMYIRPIVLWSVVRSRLVSRDPLVGGGARLGRETIGAGAIVIVAAHFHGGGADDQLGLRPAS